MSDSGLSRYFATQCANLFDDLTQRGVPPKSELSTASLKSLFDAFQGQDKQASAERMLGACIKVLGHELFHEKILKAIWKKYEEE